MAVADVFTAITENRPYRAGMDDKHAVGVLNNMVDNGALDGKLVGILTVNFNMFNDIREAAQEEAKEQNDKFLPDHV
jgi:HD-GYP domain-containing protein (c-di-GMP phosphodiesterase class II)